ncbi:MAG: hypothetical protein MMC23_001719 [Stictis urceolatum]|nr:hypothetical protein [Stictis urceolata]
MSTLMYFAKDLRLPKLAYTTALETENLHAFDDQCRYDVMDLSHHQLAAPIHPLVLERIWSLTTAFPALRTLALTEPRAHNPTVVANSWAWIRELAENAPQLRHVDFRLNACEAETVKLFHSEDAAAHRALGLEGLWKSDLDALKGVRKTGNAVHAAVRLRTYAGRPEWFVPAKILEEEDEDGDSDWASVVESGRMDILWRRPGPGRCFEVLLEGLNVCLERRAAGRE